MEWRLANPYELSAYVVGDVLVGNAVGDCLANSLSSSVAFKTFSALGTLLLRVAFSKGV